MVRGLSRISVFILALDRVGWALQDTQVNRRTLIRSRPNGGPGEWQSLHAVCLMNTCSHLIHSIRSGAFATREVSPFIAAR